jgi:hypothetical protein
LNKLSTQKFSTLTQGVAIELDLFKPLQGISGGYQFSIPNSQLSILTPPTLLVFSFYLLLLKDGLPLQGHPSKKSKIQNK